MPFICTRRADIPEGLVRVDDLWPRKAPRESAIYDPVPQGDLYLRQPLNERVFVAERAAAERLVRTDFRGLTAYILDAFSSPVGEALTGQEAHAVAVALIERMRDGESLTLADHIDIHTAELGGPPADFVATAVTDTLRILSGESYLLPAGSLLQDDGGDWVPELAGQWEGKAVGRDSYYDSYYDGRFVYNNSDLRKSMSAGRIFGFLRSDFRHLGVEGPAVVVYNDNGTLMD